ncbi:dipeptidase [Apibacter muscae]|uniref:Dipeptidase n=1 Tax=Apibacter muscae TaxID=2509004 RepID=A0A563D9G1_9FLAO|nr:dipeptidase [Apibacter muscae]TWP26846.1 dipeptidase [Apibacter muscae]
MDKVYEFQKKNKDRFLNELLEILKIPSISADSNYSKEIIKCANAISDNCVLSGLDNVEICSTNGNPIVYGEKIIAKDLPTVLVYGHYDVQPPDPLNLWENDPFQPIIRKTNIHPEGAIFARGSADDKGQVFMHLKALESLIKTSSLPCNVKLLIEGEEEIGSPNLGDFIKNNKEKFSCDVILVSDTHLFSLKVPTITTGLRGLCYLEVEIQGADRDLHSGLYGGAVPNPIYILSKMIASLIDSEGKITIPGFYDQVDELSNKDREELNKIPFDEEIFKNSIGIKGLDGEKGYNTLERTSIRPTLDINGIWGGYTGEGAKTIIPSKAYAKISMRLVPNQDPDKISQLFIQHLKKIAPPNVTVNVTSFQGGKAYVLPSEHIGYKAAKKAMEKGFNLETLPYRTGGSIPIISLMEEVLKVKSVLLGFGLDTDAIHSPNEHYGIFNFYKGIEVIPYFYKYYQQMKKDKSHG